MLQELQPEPTTLDIVTALIDSKQPQSIHDMLICGGIEYSRAIQTGLKTMLKEDAVRWLPKSTVDLDKEWVAYRESQIRRPL